MRVAAGSGLLTPWVLVNCEAQCMLFEWIDRGTKGGRAGRRKKEKGGGCILLGRYHLQQKLFLTAQKPAKRQKRDNFIPE